jgi:thiol-disulfide isomerase/thioredoxin
VWLAVGAVVLVVAVGLAVALSGSSDTETDGALVFGEVTATGAPLPTFVAGEVDPAVGVEAPSLVGQGLDGGAVAVGGGGQPTLLAFLAHWCPHCQVELPVLVELADQGAYDGMRAVAVVTGTNSEAPNYPPSAWLEREAWTGEVLVDDEAATAATAYGLAGYPYLVVLDADGAVVARVSGEVPAEQVVALLEAAGAGQR